MNFQAARPGTRTSGSSKPEFKLLSVYNRFQLNSVASKLVNAQNGDYITIYCDSDLPFEEAYAIGINTNPKLQAKLASVKGLEGVGRKLTFNYGGMYAQMLQQDPKAPEVSAKGLVEMGLMHENETDKGNTTILANQVIVFEVGEPFKMAISEDEEITLYPLTNPSIEVVESDEINDVEED